MCLIHLKLYIFFPATPFFSKILGPFHLVALGNCVIGLVNWFCPRWSPMITLGFFCLFLHNLHTVIFQTRNTILVILVKWYFQNTISITIVKFHNTSWICVPGVTITSPSVYLAFSSQAFIAKQKKYRVMDLLLFLTTT